MSSVLLDLFAEDRAHEAFLGAMVQRIAHEEGQRITVQPRAARGGHGRAIQEFEIYQKAALAGLTSMPDLLVVCIDANCQRFNQARAAIEEKMREPFRDMTVIACPDPHVERWYLADPQACQRVIGAQPGSIKRKCERDRYKSILSKTIREAGQIPTLGGVEFARDLVEEMDLYQAGRNDHSLRAFVEDLRNRLRARNQPIVSEY